MSPPLPETLLDIYHLLLKYKFNKNMGEYASQNQNPNIVP